MRTNIKLFSNLKQKFVQITTAGLCCIMLLAPLPASAASVSNTVSSDLQRVTAKAKPVMSQINMSWDLKNNKAVKLNYIYPKEISEYRYGEFKKTGKFTIKNFKKTTVGNNNKLSFTAVFNLPTSYTKKEIKDIFNYGYATGDWSITSFYIDYVDYNTGKSLSKDKRFSFKSSDWKRSNIKTLVDTYSNSNYDISTKMSLDVTVTYPKSFKSLCIVVGSCPPDSANDDYDNGKITFKSTNSYSPKDKLVCHGMRIK